MDNVFESLIFNSVSFLRISQTYTLKEPAAANGSLFYLGDGDVPLGVLQVLIHDNDVELRRFSPVALELELDDAVDGVDFPELVQGSAVQRPLVADASVFAVEVPLQVGAVFVLHFYKLARVAQCWLHAEAY